ncbi:MAG: Bug family tripartite tricarboxylate transporter substrate binding protein [Xanthobacteraceae bacterium]
MLTRRGVLAASAAAISLSGFVGRAAAQVLKKQVHMIIGFPAGGGTDVVGRLFAEKMRGPYADTILIENKPGAAARLSVEYVKNADPDGSVMLYTPDFPITVYPHSFKSLNYDSLADFTPVAPTTRSMLTFNVGPMVPENVKTLTDFIKWAKDNPDKSNFATTAAGGTPHFVGVMIANAAGVKITAVHYRGGAPAMQDLIGGHIAASVNPVSEAIPLAQDGKLRILAGTGSQRSRFLPDVPTIREQGYDVVLDSWSGIFLPSRTPMDVVNALSKTIGDVCKMPDIIESLAKFGNEPGWQPQPEFAARVKADIERWGPVVKASGFVATD